MPQNSQMSQTSAASRTKEDHLSRCWGSIPRPHGLGYGDVDITCYGRNSDGFGIPMRLASKKCDNDHEYRLEKKIVDKLWNMTSETVPQPEPINLAPIEETAAALTAVESAAGRRDHLTDVLTIPAVGNAARGNKRKTGNTDCKVKQKYTLGGLKFAAQKEMVAECLAHGLAIHGKKSVLTKRLKGHYQQVAHHTAKKAGSVGIGRWLAEN